MCNVERGGALGGETSDDEREEKEGGDCEAENKCDSKSRQMRCMERSDKGLTEWLSVGRRCDPIKK